MLKTGYFKMKNTLVVLDSDSVTSSAGPYKREIDSDFSDDGDIVRELGGFVINDYDSSTGLYDVRRVNFKIILSIKCF